MYTKTQCNWCQCISTAFREGNGCHACLRGRMVAIDSNLAEAHKKWEKEAYQSHAYQAQKQYEYEIEKKEEWLGERT